MWIRFERISLGACLIILFSPFFVLASGGGWFKVDKGGLDENIYSIGISPQDENIIYCGSNRAVFRSLDGGKSWKPVFLVAGSDNRVNHILADPENKDTVYVALNSGVFKSGKQGENFENIFKSSLASDKVNFITKSFDNKLYLSTDNGIYAADTGYVWQKIGSLPVGTKVYELVFSPDKKNIFAVTDSGLYKSSDGLNTAERIFTSFVSRGDSSPDSGQDSFSDEESEINGNAVTTLLVDTFNPRNIYLGTNKGLFVSKNNGQTFNRLMILELGRVSIRRVINDVNNKTVIYVLTDKGFFEIDLSVFQAGLIYDGLPTNNLRFCLQDSRGRILLASDKGLYERKLFSSFADSDIKKNSFANEPGIDEIRAAALRYNEVSPEKIAAWRKSLKFRALFPELQLDYDKTVTTALGASYDRTQVGPRDWGLSLSWDIADLVWNTNEDSVDTRSRLNTQLRIDILDEVNRLYFERKRLITQIAEDSSFSPEEIMKINLRVEELSASLDNYTGGYFSNIQKIRSRK